MKGMVNWAVAALMTAALTAPAQAEQAKQIGQLEVHYSAIPTTLIAPQVAKAYNIKRSKVQGLLNIAILDTRVVGKPAVAGSVSGEASNLLGSKKALEFQEVREGKAIYYLATFGYTNEETLRFKIDISVPGKSTGRLEFNQKFYVD
ncbi:DUF4426 domain-containing protein [Parasalinivibrio latis]|uniref:DUF4426 domain-containing protein n=1 Tax=Parasalinivibrio latis TaxID=2952610 RepID=UPI0030E1685C